MRVHGSATLRGQRWWFLWTGRSLPRWPSRCWWPWRASLRPIRTTCPWRDAKTGSIESTVSSASCTARCSPWSRQALARGGHFGRDTGQLSCRIGTPAHRQRKRRKKLAALDEARVHAAQHAHGGTRDNQGRAPRHADDAGLPPAACRSRRGVSCLHRPMGRGWFHPAEVAYQLSEPGTPWIRWTHVRQAEERAARIARGSLSGTPTLVGALIADRVGRGDNSLRYRVFRYQSSGHRAVWSPSRDWGYWRCCSHPSWKNACASPSWPRGWVSTPRVWRPRTSPGIASRSYSARPERKPVSAMGGVRADTSGASGITSRRNGVAQRSKLRDAHRWPSCTTEPWCQRLTTSASVRVNPSDGSCAEWPIRRYPGDAARRPGRARPRRCPRWKRLRSPPSRKTRHVQLAIVRLRSSRLILIPSAFTSGPPRSPRWPSTATPPPTSCSTMTTCTGASTTTCWIWNYRDEEILEITYNDWLTQMIRHSRYYEEEHGTGIAASCLGG